MPSRPLAVFDLDGTLYRWSFYLEFIEQLARFQRVSPAHFVASQAHQRAAKAHGSEETYLSKYVHDWEEKAISGLSEGEVVSAMREVLRTQKNRSYLFSNELFAILREANYEIIAMSGSPSQMVEVLCREWKFDAWYGTEYVMDDRKLFARDQSMTKRVDQMKGSMLRKFFDEGTYQREGSIAIGDTLEDWSMLELVEYPIAFNPEQGCVLKARQTGIPIVWERKDVILAYQTSPQDLTKSDDAFLFREAAWEKLLPSDIAKTLRKRLENARLLAE